MATNLDSSEAFKYIWLNWRIMGLYPFSKYRELYTIYAVLINVFAVIISPSQIIVQLLYEETFADLIKNLSTSLDWIVGCIKHTVIIIWHQKLREGHRYLRSLDLRVQVSEEERLHMQRIVKNCHFLYRFYNILFFSAVSYLITKSIINSSLMFSEYMFWDCTTSTSKFWLGFLYQVISTTIESILNLTSDAYAISYVYVVVGHFQTLGIRIMRIGYDEKASQEENYQELIKCIHDHRSILRFFDHIRPVISRTILIQFMATALSQCLAVVNLVYLESNFIMLIAAILYIPLLMGQIMPCCLMVNNLMDSSDHLTTALYSCNWMDQSPKFKKTMIIFMQRTQLISEIKAGDMVPVTVETCVSIIRLSFSMYTVLSQMRNGQK